MDYQKLINKLSETSRRVKQLETILCSITQEVEDDNMDLIVLNILEDAIKKINSIYDIDSITFKNWNDEPTRVNAIDKKEEYRKEYRNGTLDEELS